MRERKQRKTKSNSVQDLTLSKMKKPKRDVRPREVRRMVLPLYFGYGLKLALVKIGDSYIRKIFGIRKWWQEAVALILIVAVVASNILFFQAPGILGATYHWVQMDWSGGADTVHFPTHPTDQTGWTKFYLKDPGIIAGPDLTLNLTPGFVTQTTDLDWVDGTFHNAKVVGTGTAAEITLNPSPSSDTFKILNPVSNPKKKGIWEVRFETKGRDYLAILPIQNAQFGKDIQFEGLYCGENLVLSETTQNYIYHHNWYCDQIGYLRVKVLTSGPRLLKFNFGGITQMAKNFTCDSGTLSDTCIVSTTHTIPHGNIITGTGNLVIQSGGNLTTAAGDRFTIDMTGPTSFVRIETGGAITGNLDLLRAVNVDIQTGASINVNAKGHAGGGHRANGSGPGRGIYGAGWHVGSGAGYGGTGGKNVRGDPGGSAYGSLTNPTDLGSGGGGTWHGVGGAGGGAIRLDISGTLTINGTITADGGHGTANTEGRLHQDGGGGSGGSIWITAGTITGTGTITANGGSGDTHGGGGAGGRVAIYYTTDTHTGTITAFGGTGRQAGGAGTIFTKNPAQVHGVLIMDNNMLAGPDTPLPSVVANVPDNWTFDDLIIINHARLTNIATLTVHSPLNMGAGTAITATSITGFTSLSMADGAKITVDTDLTVPNPLNMGANASINAANLTVTGGSLTMGANAHITAGNNVTAHGSITMGNNAHITTGNNVTASTSLTMGTNSSIITTNLTVTGAGSTLTLQSGASITHPHANTAGLTITAENVDIQTGASINVNARGHAGGGHRANGSGPGRGIYGAGWHVGSGAGYGGTGGKNAQGDLGGSAYGSLTNPTDLGSGGGGTWHGVGGAGGGAIRLDISGTLTINGTITADGGHGTANTEGRLHQDGGGGSGGSIWITAGTITGTGTITANGGSGDTHGGGGAGGRVAIYRKTDNFTGTTTVNGGTGSGAGGTGTIYLGFAYSPSGTFISSAIDTGGNLGFSTLDFTISEPAGTDLKFQLRTADTEAGLAATPWLGPDGTNTTYYTTSTTAIHHTHDSHRWVQYKAYLSTTDTLVTPILHDITINYQYYPASAQLISSPYNAGDAANVLAKISWTETLPPGTEIKFQVRTAPDSAGAPGTWTPWAGPCNGAGTANGTFSTTTFFTDPTGGEPIDADMKDETNDQWIQYKVWLKTTNPGFTPTLFDVTLTYVVNAPPEFNPDYPTVGAGGITASQGADTKVNISYSIRDIDTTAGTVTPNFVTPSFEYSLDGGISWTTIPSTALAPGDLNNKPVEEVAFTTHTATWDVKAQIPGVYSATAQIRVTVNDNEAANPIAVQTSANFTLDTKNPVAGTPPGGDTGININQNVVTDLGHGKTATTSVMLYLAATDDSSLEMIISEDISFAGANWQPYATTSAFTLSTGDGVKTVHVKFRDAKGNTSGPFSDSIILDTTKPAVPVFLTIQDISNPATAEWRIFSSWLRSTDEDFIRYEIERATSTAGVIGAWTPLKTITNKDVNYIIDKGLVEGTKYCYRVRTIDDINNPSAFSSVLCQVAGGQPADTAAPIISSVVSSAITISSARITWLTNEIATSDVIYSTNPDVPTNSPSQGVSGYTDSHSVTLTGLSSNTTYYFKVRSCDASANCAESAIFQFTTAAPDIIPPVISNVASSNITESSALITWTTDTPANSFVEFSTTMGFTPGTGTIQGKFDLVTSHSIVLQGLSLNTTYYFRVRSADVAGNEARSTEHNFTTLAGVGDVTPPAISNIATSSVTYNTATITWNTDEPASSFVEWGQTTAYGRIYGYDAFSTIHSVQLPKDLVPATTYHFRVRSVDAAGNEAISTDFTFTTAADPGDTVAPIISNVVIGQPTETSVTITWTTNEDANSYIDYSADQRIYNLSQGSPVMTTSHSVTLVGLTPSTLYYFRVQSTDPSGNTATDDNAGAGYQFVTATSVATPPVISNVQITEVNHNSAKILWTTDKASNSFVEYGFNTAYGFSQGQFSLVTSHSVTLIGLLSEATYHFRVRSTDADGLEAVSSDFTFTTHSAPDITPPVISNVEITNIDLNSATITWQTNEPADSLVDYGTSNAYGLMFGTPDVFNTSHSVDLTGLSPGTTYFFQVRSKDRSGNITTDDNAGASYQFTTLPDITAPTISNVTAAVVDQTSATIMWTTNERATSQVEWGITNAYGNLTTLDTDLKMSHSVTISGLTPETTYHFRVRSVDGANNEAISPDQTFITLAEGMVVVRRPPPPVDNIPPIIERIEITEISQTRAVISWRTNELANSLVEYGPTPAFGQLAGQTEQLLISHRVALENLTPDTLYHFQIVSLDAAGNRGVSLVQTFRTLTVEEVPEKIPEEVVEVPEEIVDIPEPRIVEFFREATEGILQHFVTNPHLTEEAFKAMVDDTAQRIVAPPLVVGEYPLVTVGPDWAEITWITDKPANSLVALAKQEDFEPERDEPYSDFFSSPLGQYTTNHKVRITGLEPDTTYHFQARSQAKIGPITKSPDQIFTTLSLLPEISEVSFTAIEENEITLEWQTTLPTKTKIEITNTETGQKVIKQDLNYLRKHHIIIPNLDPATNYSLQIISEDEQGNVSLSPVLPFTTRIWEDPPIISHVRITTSLIPGRIEKVQALISWKTDKPASSRVFFQEGVGVREKLTLSTPLSPDLVTTHLVITTAFKPGTVYQFRVQSIDALGNISYSQDFTILTPRAEETVLDLIIQQFGEIFGFLEGRFW